MFIILHSYLPITATFFCPQDLERFDWIDWIIGVRKNRSLCWWLRYIEVRYIGVLFYWHSALFKLFVDEGGDLTLYMTGKKLRPRTEPVYSGGNREDFDITRGYDTVDYTDFISSHIFNSQDILISQSMHNGLFSGIFSSSKLYNPRPATTWGIRIIYDDFLVFADKQWKCVNGKSKGIYSLACDEKFGFGVFFISSGVCQFWKKRWRHDSIVLLKTRKNRKK